jgi:hypothetical protein
MATRRPRLQVIRRVRRDGDQDYVPTAVEKLSVLITVRFQLDCSARAPRPEEERDDNSLAVELAEPYGLRQEAVARRAREADVGRHRACRQELLRWLRLLRLLRAAACGRYRGERSRQQSCRENPVHSASI